MRCTQQELPIPALIYIYIHDSLIIRYTPSPSHTQRQREEIGGDLRWIKRSRGVDGGELGGGGGCVFIQ